MANAGLSSTLNHNSWTKDDWSLFFACIIFGMIPLFIQLSAFHILWHTKFYERIVTARSQRWIVVPPSQILSFMMLVNHACISTGLFFLIYNFQYIDGVVGGVQVHHKGNFTWIVGWLVGGIMASWFPPMLIHASCNMWMPFILEVASLLGVAMTFAYCFNYSLQSTSPQLTLSTPAPWLLIWPLIFKFYFCFVAAKAAIVSVTDPDYLSQCEDERSMVSDRMLDYDERSGLESPGDMDHVVSRNLLKKDTTNFVQVVPKGAGGESSSIAFEARTSGASGSSAVQPPNVSSRHTNKNMFSVGEPLRNESNRLK
jgi:hypothetical protein